ncbi:NaeI family type II restriction endonuclease [Streptomyces subrutilus]|uniref:NaeI family type II restriction endonuclease n=1 Tax=Streptomyces subrutilus TaxID=36818 RepID=UPI002E0DEA9F|nr:hypothetical protein OG479_18620 [Streptomyces subrutilus]
MDALVLLLLDIRKQAGLSVEDLHELLRSGGQLGDQLPARSTLYRKLSGAGLMNERRLVEAVIGACVPNEQQAVTLRERAVGLLHQAWSKDAEPVPPRLEAPAINDDAMGELIKVQNALITVQIQLATALQAAAEAEKEAARSRALVSMLLALGAVKASAMREDPASGAAPELQSRLADAVAEREEAQQALRATQRRLAEAEGLLATRTMGPAGSDHPGRREWPTIRRNSANWSAAVAGRGQGADPSELDTSASSTRPYAEQGGVSLSERQFHTPEHDAGLADVLAEMLRLDPDGSRIGAVIDGAGRNLLDPVHTGRYLWSQLTKVEKTGLATSVGHRIQRELGLADGLQLDFSVAGHEVDMRFTRGGNWMFPPELQGGLCLLVRADDASGQWSLGLLRVRPELMRTGSNRDGKRGLSAQGRSAIHWIHRGIPLPEHALRQLPADVVDAIFAQPSGQARIEELFLQAQLTAITTADLSAVTMQLDGVKRARDARRRLAGRGVLVLNGTRSQDREWASALGLPPLVSGTWMSIRLAPAPQHDDSPTVTLDGTPWRVASPGDAETPLPPTAHR